ncbi:hypothetical protein [Kibdelosporangium philippinense]|uniref:hypothetical protein n=1 Tax=Kibdelosporangium philippinense TaxID=211113 RepID=UPI00361DD392
MADRVDLAVDSRAGLAADSRVVVAAGPVGPSLAAAGLAGRSYGTSSGNPAPASGSGEVTPPTGSPAWRQSRGPLARLPQGGVVEFAEGLRAAIEAARTYIYIEDQTLNPAMLGEIYVQHRFLYPLLSAAAERASR